MIGQLVKSPLTYWGGKQMLWRYIQPCIPEHETYIEPFTGGGTVFWLKNDARKTVLNDINNFVMNFYWVVKNKFEELDSLIQSSLHSRNLHKQAHNIYKNLRNHSRVEQAWAFWYLTNFSVLQNLDSGALATEKEMGRIGLHLANRKARFNKHLENKLRMATLENRDALWIIDFYDYGDAFFFVDPPYIGTYCAHYGGYNEADFAQLLAKLNELKGRFLLTCYVNDILLRAIQQYHWHHVVLTLNKISGSIFVKGSSAAVKQEVLVGNYFFDPYSEALASREFNFGVNLAS